MREFAGVVALVAWHVASLSGLDEQLELTAERHDPSRLNDACDISPGSALVSPTAARRPCRLMRDARNALADQGSQYHQRELKADPRVLAAHLHRAGTRKRGFPEMQPERVAHGSRFAAAQRQKGVP
jgi:hypothetical protein